MGALSKSIFDWFLLFHRDYVQFLCLMNYRITTNLIISQLLILLCKLYIFSFFYILIFLNLNAFAITETELKLIAKAAIIGESNNPNIGYKTPAAMGTPNTLYIKAKKRFCFMFLTTA